MRVTFLAQLLGAFSHKPAPLWVPWPKARCEGDVGGTLLLKNTNLPGSRAPSRTFAKAKHLAPASSRSEAKGDFFVPPPKLSHRPELSHGGHGHHPHTTLAPWHSSHNSQQWRSKSGAPRWLRRSLLELLPYRARRSPNNVEKMEGVGPGEGFGANPPVCLLRLSYLSKVGIETPKVFDP